MCCYRSENRLCRSVFLCLTLNFLSLCPGFCFRSRQRRFWGQKKSYVMLYWPELPTWSEIENIIWKPTGVCVACDVIWHSICKVYSFRSCLVYVEHTVHVLSVICVCVCRQCCVGTELVDWLLQQSSCVHSRAHAVGMWQVLLEEGVLNHGTPVPFAVVTARLTVGSFLLCSTFSHLYLS